MRLSKSSKKIDDIYKIGLTYEWKDAGGAAYDKFGEPLPQDTIDACKKADAILFGAVGGDQWDHLEPSLRPEKAILGLRKALGLYVNLRPVKIQDSMIEYSPLKPEIAKGTDIMIVRELVQAAFTSATAVNPRSITAQKEPGIWKTTLCRKSTASPASPWKRPASVMVT